ncbi:MAG: winged helix DNA-binding domain-containing protein [Propionibacteriales bacterium]|nr:winged helix DNA-binding domain-containing protein [Propionibacteriales bacterium]
MRQQLLEPVGTDSVADVVRRLGAVPAQRDVAAELAVRARRQLSQLGEVTHALAEGRIIKTFAFRGATHLLTPEDGGVYLTGRQSDVGAPQLAEPLRPDAIRLATASGGGPRGACRRGR